MTMVVAAVHKYSISLNNCTGMGGDMIATVPRNLHGSICLKLTGFKLQQDTVELIRVHIPLNTRAANGLSLQWCYNKRDGVSHHQTHDCLLSRLSRRRSKKRAKLRVTDLCEGSSPVTGEFTPQRASNAENVSIWWRHNENFWCEITSMIILMCCITWGVKNVTCHIIWDSLIMIFNEWQS